MKKSQLQQLVREVLQETIRKVDGKYVVYPEKGGKRLGTHSTRKAAEKQLTAIHLNKEVVSPPDGVYRESWLFSQMQQGNKDILYLVTKHPGINTSEELEIFEKAKELGYGFLKVNHSRGEPYIVYVNTPQAKTKAKELLKIANKHGGYLNDQTPEEAREIGRLLDYLDTDTEDYIARRYKHTNKSSQDVNEIGDASASPYSYTPDGWVDPPNFRYSFKTDSGIEYRVYLEPTDSYESLKDYSISFAAKGTGKDDWWSFETVHSKGELYKVMSTVVSIIKDFLKANQYVTKLTFSPSSKDGEDNIDNQRAKLYSAFIKRQIPNAEVISDDDAKLITIKLPKKFKNSLRDKEEEVNEIGDASAKTYDITIKSEGDRKKEYTFTTDPVKVKDEQGKIKEVPGTDYLVTFYLNTFRSRSIGSLSYDLAFEAKSFEDDDYHFSTVNEGNMYKVMATIVKIAKYFMKTTPGLTELSFTPYPKSGESRIDNKRGKLYMAYLAKHLPDDVTIEPDFDTNRVFVKLPEKKELNEISYTEPRFGAEWEEAIRYPEFQEMGRREWIKRARSGYTINYSKIKDVLGNVDLNFKNLEIPKQKRFQSAFQQGNIEMPIVVKFSDNDYDLVAGNTRLSGLIKNGIDPKVWVVDISDLQENYADGKVKGKSRPGRVKKAGASCKGSVTDLRAKAKKYGGEKGKMYHWCANMKAGKK